MANYCMKHGILCENATIYGHCKITACSKYLQTNETNNYIQLNQTISLEKIIFPQTIGNVTSYNASHFSIEYFKEYFEERGFNVLIEKFQNNWCRLMIRWID